jgi:hypothetical protein
LVGRVAFYALPADDAPGVPQHVIDDRAKFAYSMPTTYPVTLSWRRAVRAVAEGVPLPRLILDQIHTSTDGQAWLDAQPIAYILVNLTPHSVNVVGPARWNTHGDRSPLFAVPSTGQAARLCQKAISGGALLDPRTPPMRNLGKVTGLPAPEPGVLYIVSMAVAREHVPGGRSDLIAPGTKSTTGSSGCEDFVRYV